MELNTRTSIPTGADLDTYTTPGSYVSVNSLITQSLLHKPKNVSTGAYLDVYKLHDDGSFTQVMRQWGDGVYSVRSINKQTGLITEWVPYAPASLPKEYDLPLVDGITGTAKYYKTQEGLIVIHGWILGASLNTVLATLPEGFRPKYYTIRSSISSALNPSIGLIRVEVSVLGEIKITAWNDVGTLASGAAISMDFMSAG